MLHYHYVHIYHDQSKIVVKIVSKFVVTNMVTFKSELGSLALRICARPSLKYRPGAPGCIFATEWGLIDSTQPAPEYGGGALRSFKVTKIDK